MQTNYGLRSFNQLLRNVKFKNQRQDWVIVMPTLSMNWIYTVKNKPPAFYRHDIHTSLYLEYWLLKSLHVRLVLWVIYRYSHLIFITALGIIIPILGWLKGLRASQAICLRSDSWIGLETRIQLRHRWAQRLFFLLCMLLVLVSGGRPWLTPVLDTWLLVEKPWFNVKLVFFFLFCFNLFWWGEGR